MLRMRQRYRNYIICGNVYEYVILGEVCDNCIWYPGRYYFMAFWACGTFFFTLYMPTLNISRAAF